MPTEAADLKRKLDRARSLTRLALTAWRESDRTAETTDLEVAVAFLDPIDVYDVGVTDMRDIRRITRQMTSVWCGVAEGDHVLLVAIGRAYIAAGGV